MLTVSSFQNSQWDAQPPQTPIRSKRAVRSPSLRRMRAGPDDRRPHWEFLSRCATRSGAKSAVTVAVLLALVGLYYSQDLQIGDLDAGAPELHPDSRYNLDSAYVNAHYGTSSDVLVIMVETQPERCSQFEREAHEDAGTPYGDQCHEQRADRRRYAPCD